jgi:predicted nucleic acid-binding protein
MRIVDTSLWIELFSGGPLFEQARDSIQPVESTFVPAMVHYEVVKWVKRTTSEENADSILSLLLECRPAIMDSNVAARAAVASLAHKLDATDAIIYATAQILEVDLFTCDSHFEGLPGVKYFGKKP